MKSGLNCGAPRWTAGVEAVRVGIDYLPSGPQRRVVAEGEQQVEKAGAAGEEADPVGRRFDETRVDGGHARRRIGAFNPAYRAAVAMEFGLGRGLLERTVSCQPS